MILLEVVAGLANMKAPIIEIFIKATLLYVFVLWVLTQFRSASASIKKFVWLCFFTTLLVLPGWVILRPIEFAIPLLTAQSSDFYSHDYPDSVSQLVDAGVILIAAYCFLVSIQMASFFVSLYELRKISISAAPFQSDIQCLCGEKILVSSDIDMPFTWGIYRPEIIFPAESYRWTKAQILCVLEHEKAHVKHKDWFLFLITRWIAIFYCPLLFVNKAHQQFMLESESFADDAALRSDLSAHCYAQTLVDFVKHQFFRSSRVAAKFSTSFADGLHIKARVTRLFDPIVCRANISLAEIAACITITFVAGLLVMVITVTPGSLMLDIRTIMVVKSPETTSEPEFSSIFEHAETFMQPVVRPAHVSGRNKSKKFIYSELELVRTNLFENQKLFEFSREVDVPKILMAATRVEQSAPKYPVLAERRRISGEVRVTYDVNKQGLVENTKIIHSKPRGVFDKSVVQALNEAKFIPSRLNKERIIAKGIEQLFTFDSRARKNK